jgi:hypothetical protein
MHDPSLHLFVDDYHIRNAHCLKRVFFALEQTREPVMTDIDGRYVCWGSVMRDAGKYRCWYLSCANVSTKDLAAAGVWGKGSDFSYHPDRHPDAIPIEQFEMIGYAESEDGLRWTKPNLNLCTWRGSTANNICFDSTGPQKQYDGFVTNLDGCAVVRDEAESDPAKRYKMISHWESLHCWDSTMVAGLDRPKEIIDKYWAHRAKYLTTSPDGIHWDKNITRVKNVEGGDYCGVVRDERNQQWWFADRPTGGTGMGYCRLAGLSASKDLYHWPAHLEQVMFPGEFEDYGHRFEHHGWTPFNYGDQDLALLELSFAGPGVFSVLCSHRDGERWRILNHAPVLQIGPRGSPDDTMLAATCNAPFVVGDKLRFYYNGRSYSDQGRTGGLFAAHLRLDGFAGMTVDTIACQRYKKPAVLQTRLLAVGEDRLRVNIAGHHQSAQVAILNEDFKPIRGYDVTECLPLAEDGTRTVVRWKDHGDVAALKGKNVYVNIKLNAGTIYSIRI